MSMRDLHCAIKAGDYERVTAILWQVLEHHSQGKNLLNHCFEFLTPLCLACKENREDIVIALLSAGANSNAPSEYLDKCPLHFACDHREGNMGIVRHLLRAKADINVCDSYSNTGLHIACIRENVSIVRFLLENGADAELCESENETPLVKACNSCNLELVEIFIRAGCDVNYPDSLPLDRLIRHSSVDGVKLLVKSGADIYKEPYMSFAAERNELEMMKLLKSYRVPVNRVSSGLGFTALHRACISHDADNAPVRLLLGWGSDVNLASVTGDTALHYACQQFNVDKVRLLLAYGADVNTVDMTQLSPLLAVLTTMCPADDVEVYRTLTRLLLAAGARVSAEILNCLQFFMPFVLSQSETQEATVAVIDYVKAHATTPRSLKKLCRIVVRDCLHPDRDRSAAQLGMPPLLQDYLTFKDIV
jgi:ankyrin repeat protein